MSETDSESVLHHLIPDENFKWSESRVRRLISLVKENRHLWHNLAPGFTGNPSKRMELFIHIAEEIGTTAFEANRRFTSLRERYGKESKRQEEGFECTWAFFQDLNFLNEVIRRRDKRKSVKIEKEQVKQELSQVMEVEETTDDDYFASMHETHTKDNDEIRYVTHTIKTDPLPNKRKKVDDTHASQIYLIDEHTEQQELEDQAVEAAFKYFRLELKKMDQQKREHCIDKMMMAFLNAKTSYPN